MRNDYLYTIQGTGTKINYGIDKALEQQTEQIAGKLQTTNYKREKPLSVWAGKVDLDWILNNNEQGSIGSLANKETVLEQIRLQVKWFFNSGGNASGSNEGVTENMALAYELWINQGLTLSAIGKLLNTSQQTVTKWLVKFFSIVNLKLTVGLHCKSKLLDRFIVPEVLSLRMAAQRKRAWKRANKGNKAVRQYVQMEGLTVAFNGGRYDTGFIVTKEYMNHALNSSFTWECQSGQANLPLNATREKQLPIPRDF
ncbi:hypothetical protein [Neobacillus vireti]|uniref:Uncharacterized protein n=1 Tax=Neobacillus vireti LMG 21834 TaxID=1131730 RepID=A0AB94IJT3_9BACI|nr:hypothetical protein [Neobacillus vireti]ETI67263.1 hypothetical protein BAVI_18477 [Neobacillus vireti LMG 21834]KLT19658.1 hypothetical protein AA980_03445 [Neobacillus vireti]